MLLCILPINKARFRQFQIRKSVAFQVLTGCQVTMGQESEDGGRWPFAGACGAVSAMGSQHVPKNVDVSF